MYSGSSLSCSWPKSQGQQVLILTQHHSVSGSGIKAFQFFSCSDKEMMVAYNGNGALSIYIFYITQQQQQQQWKKYILEKNIFSPKLTGCKLTAQSKSKGYKTVFLFYGIYWFMVRHRTPSCCLIDLMLLNRFNRAPYPWNMLCPEPSSLLHQIMWEENKTSCNNRKGASA